MVVTDAPLIAGQGFIRQGCCQKVWTSECFKLCDGATCLIKTITRRELAPPLVRARERRWSLHKTRTRRILLLWVILCCSLPRVMAQENGHATGSIEGQVFLSGIGQHQFITGAAVAARGPVLLNTETDANGKYLFAEVPPGEYTISAAFSGSKAEQTVVVDPNRKVQLKLQIKLAEATTVRVHADDTDSNVAASEGTITEKTIRDAPNLDERFETLLPLIPGVVRGPDGHINLKGASNTQAGALVNNANVTDPATGSPAINLPIDVVSSVQVISNPWDPQYGKFTGAVSSVETKTGSYEGRHFSIQNVLPRWRERGGHIVGLGAATPRMTFTGPLVRHRIAFTQSLEYRFVRTPVNSLPPLQRDTTLEGVSSYTQFDLNMSPRQTATVSLAIYPQKLQYMGLNTFTPQPSTADFHQRGYELSGQDRYITGPESILVSQISYKQYDADVTAVSDDPFELLIDTTLGGCFNRQGRRSNRFEWDETYNFAPRHLLGIHKFKVGLNYAYSSYDGHEAFLPVTILGASGAPIEHISFTPSTSFTIDQSETSWFAGDQWVPWQRLSINLGLRFDNDTVTGSTHVAPRAGVVLALTRDGKTLLKGGAGLFYDRVPLTIPTFEKLPDRTVTILDADGNQFSSTAYVNQLTRELQNPRSASWNVALERQVLEPFAIRVGFEQRNTSRVLTVSPVSFGTSGILLVSNSGRDVYREFQVSGRYKLPRLTINGSYVRSLAYGNLNDPSLFFGDSSQPVIQPDSRARLSFDAPNRFLFSGNLEGPWKFTLLPVYDLHTGFPYSVESEWREYVGQRQSRQFPRFSSLDLQVSRPVSLHMGDRSLHLRAGFGVFNVLNHFNPRDVQNVEESSLFGEFFNDAWRDYRGKLVFQF